MSLYIKFLVNTEIKKETRHDGRNDATCLQIQEEKALKPMIRIITITCTFWQCWTQVSTTVSVYMKITEHG